MCSSMYIPDSVYRQASIKQCRKRVVHGDHMIIFGLVAEQIKRKLIGVVHQGGITLSTHAGSLIQQHTFRYPHFPNLIKRSAGIAGHEKNFARACFSTPLNFVARQP